MKLTVQSFVAAFGVAAAVAAYDPVASAQSNAPLLGADGMPMPAANAPAATLRAALGANAADVLTIGDDNSSAAISLLATAWPAGFCYVNRQVTNMFVNNNGNITFNAAVPTFTPVPFPITNNPMVAPWWADVDTRNGPAAPALDDRVYWDLRRGRMTITWYRVGYFNSNPSRRNNFQIVVTSQGNDAMGRPDGRNYDIEFRYGNEMGSDLSWYVGQASNGNMNGLCDLNMMGVPTNPGCIPAQAGFDGGDLASVVYLPHSRTIQVLQLDTESNVGLPGIWRFPVRNCGAPACGDGNLNPGEECDDGNTRSGDGCSNTCRTERANGQACVIGTQCRSGNCVDGVCCDSVCNGQCEACNRAGALGTCGAVVGAPVAPRAACGGPAGQCAAVCDGVNRMTCTSPATCTGPNCTAGRCVAGACQNLANQCIAPTTCNLLTNTCQGCRNNADCSGGTPFCDLTLMPTRCVSCRTSADCGGATPVCNPATRTCQGCVSNADCRAPTAICDVGGTNTCVGCRNNGDCPMASPICNPGTRTCVACRNNGDCRAPTPICNPMNACVGCLNNGDCGGSTPFCNAGTSTCVACRNSGDCSGNTPVCNAMFVCAPCARNADCPASAPVCNVMTGACRGCVVNGDCRAPTPVCDGARGQCVGCNGDPDCGGSTPICDLGRRVCVGCVRDANCAAPTPLCDLGLNACVACRGNADCAGATPVCEPIRRVCVGCLADGDCRAPTPRCDGRNNTCAGCLSNADCSGSTPVCNPMSRACVACLSNMDCSGATPICNVASNVCRPCNPMNAAVDCPNAGRPFCSSMGATSGTCVQAPPTITNPMNGSSSTNTRPVIRGRATPGQVVRVYIDGMPVGDATADADGNWSLPVAAGLTGGMHTVAAANVDAMVVGPQGTPSTFTITMCMVAADCSGSTPVCDAMTRLCRPCSPGNAMDCSAPRPVCAAAGVNAGRCIAVVPVITSPMDGAMTASRRPEIRGVGAPNSTVSIRIDGMEVGTAMTDADGNFTFTPMMDLPAGMHTIAAAPVLFPGGADAGAGDAGVAGMPGPSIRITVTNCANSAECSGGTPICEPGTMMCRACDPMREAMDCPNPMAPKCETMGPNTGRCVARPPRISSPMTGTMTATKRPVITGTGTPGKVVVITVNGMEVGRATVDAMGNWSFTPDRDLPTGMITVGASDVDDMGMVLPPADSVMITIPECVMDNECMPSQRCDRATGRCLDRMADAGIADTGVIVDSGRRDSGSSNVDAGASMDATSGSDGGVRGNISGDGLCSCRAAGHSTGTNGNGGLMALCAAVALTMTARRRRANGR